MGHIVLEPVAVLDILMPVFIVDLTIIQMEIQCGITMEQLALEL